MHALEAFLGLLVAVTVLAVVARRLRLPYPILMVLGGVGAALIPGLPEIRLDSELVFLLILPPILYGAAWFSSWRDIRRNARPIGLLAIGCVLFTAVAIAMVAHWAVPGMPWGAAFVLGAIVSPPDAVAATSVFQRLAVPRRIVTILEGESLINDATGLVAYRFAVAAVLTGGISLWSAGLQFLWGGIGGVLVGLGVGWIGLQCHRRMPDPTTEIILSLLLPYAAYLPAEAVHASGVLATVTAGLYIARQSASLMSPATRVQAEGVWTTFIFLLNATVFILIGLQLRGVLQDIGSYSAAMLLRSALLVSAATVVVRIVWVFPATYLPRWLVRRIREQDPIRSWRWPALIAWNGMRGVVSLAAALALPFTTAGGEAFPYRSLIVFLAFVVILVTLLGYGLTLPVVIRWLAISDDGEKAREEREARVAASEAALERLLELEERAEVAADALERIRGYYEERLRRLRSGTHAMDGAEQTDRYGGRRLRREAIAAERNAVIRLRNAGTIGDDVLHLVQHDLDLEELRGERHQHGL